MNFKQTKQQGFTLIELIIVIIILGILAVTAAPKFLDIQDDATESTLAGVDGSVRSLSNIVRSGFLVGNNPATITLEDVTVNVASGYAAARDICLAVGLNTTTLTDGTDSTTATLDGNLECVYTDVAAGDTMVIQPTGNTNCGVTYTEAGTGLTVPTVVLDDTCDA